MLPPKARTTLRRSEQGGHITRAVERRISSWLSRALDEGRCSDDVFRPTCGAPLDTLWQEFMVEKRTQGHE
jgi:hypothetical protein